MRWSSLLPALLLSGTADAAGRSIAHAGKRHAEHAAKRLKPPALPTYPQLVDREEKPHKFLTANTTSKHATAQPG